MNLTQLQQEAARLLSDKNNDRWSLDVLTTRINLAQIEIQGYTAAVKTQYSLSTDAGVSNIVVNSDTMNIIRIVRQRSDGTLVPFQGKTNEELDYLNPDWRQWPIGEPLYWFFEESVPRIVILPAPDASNAISGGLTVYASLKPADLVNPTDIPFNSSTPMIPYNYAIVHWVVAHCFMDDGTPEALAKSKFHRSGSMEHPGEYEKELGRIMAEFDAPEAIPSRVMYKPQGARVGFTYWPSKSYPFIT